MIAYNMEHILVPFKPYPHVGYHWETHASRCIAGGPIQPLRPLSLVGKKKLALPNQTNKMVAQDEKKLYKKE